MIREDGEGAGGGPSAAGPLAGRLKYQRLARDLEVELRTRYHPGQRFESETSLSRRLGLNRETVHKAVCLLEQEGLLETRGLRGAFVRDYRESGLDSGIIGVAMAIRNHLFDQLFLALSNHNVENKRFTLICDFTGMNPKNPFGERMTMEQMRERLEQSLRFRPRTVVTDLSTLEQPVLTVLTEGAPRFRNVIMVNQPRLPVVPHAASVIPDHAAARRLQAVSARRAGYDRVGLVVPFVWPEVEKFRQDIRSAVNGGFPAAEQGLFVESDPRLADKVAEFIRKGGRPAILCHYDYGAHKLKELLAGFGLTAPDDVGLYGANNTPWALEDNLTSVGFDPDVWAREVYAAERELEENGQAADRMIPPVLYERGSTRKNG